MKQLCSSLLGITLLSCIHTTAFAATVSWPGPIHSLCAGLTLQECLDAASAGDVVQVRTNVAITEDLTIAKSLTLKAATGFSPLLDAFHSVFLTNPNPNVNTVVFQDFTLAQGRVSAVQTSNFTFNIGLRNLTILNTFNDGPEIEIRGGSSTTFGAVVFDVSNNHLTVPANSQFSGAEVISVQGGTTANMTGTIRGNHIDDFDGGQSGAIDLYNDAARPLHVDVIANEIRGSNYNDGVLLFQYGTGSSEVRFLDNLVVGQTSLAGAPGAYVIDISSGSAVFDIDNNTAAAGGIGALVAGRDDLGASWTGTVANNIVAGMTGAGITFQQPTLTSGTVDNDHNLVFTVGYNNFTPGPGTLFSDPLFVGGTDYHLTDPSPARNQGNDARVPGDLTADLDGNARKVGQVDMGAYESTTTASSPLTQAGVNRLLANVPNPFHPSTAIRYDLAQPARVRLGVFDVRGRLVRWLVSGALQQAGPHVTYWDGRAENGLPMPPGIYLDRLEVNGFVASHRMVMLR